MNLNETLDSMIKLKTALHVYTPELQAAHKKVSDLQEELESFWKNQEEDMRLLVTDELYPSVKLAAYTDLTVMEDFLKEKIHILEEYLES